MSLIKEFYPQCDECGLTNPDMLSKTKKELKRAMVANDWTTKAGKDYCNICSEKLQITGASR